MHLRNAAAALAMTIMLSSFLLADDIPTVLHLGPQPATSDAPVKAVSAVLVKAPEGDWPNEGNVQVTYSDGQSKVVTTDGRDSFPKVVGGGMVGWVNNIGQDPKYGRVKTVLQLMTPDGTTKTWECNALFIFDWGLVDGDSHLVLRSIQHHGNWFFIEYDLKTGRTLGEIDHYVPYDELPKWAQAYCSPNI